MSFDEEVVQGELKRWLTVRLDMPDDRNEALFEKYFIPRQGVPELVLLDSRGGYLDRIHSAFRSPRMKAELERIRGGRDTFAGYRRDLAKSPGELAIWIRYGRKARAIGNAKEAERVRAIVAARSAGASGEALCLLRTQLAFREDTPDAVIVKLREAITTPGGGHAVQEAHVALVRYLLQSDRTAEAKLSTAIAEAAVSDALLADDLALAWESYRTSEKHKAILDRFAAAKKRTDTSSMLDIAREALETRTALEAAIGWIDELLASGGRQSATLALYARLCAEQYDYPRAIHAMEEALTGATDVRRKSDWETDLARWKAAYEARRGRRGSTASPSK